MSEFIADSKQSAIDLAATLQKNDPTLNTEIVFRPPNSFVVRTTPAGQPATGVGPVSGATGDGTIVLPGVGTTGFVARAVQIATQEWDFFGQQTFDLNGHTTHIGHKENEDGFSQRIGQYFLEGTNTHGVDGGNQSVPWSAAFISFVMKQAGAGSRFRYSTLHAVYISQAIRDRLSARTEAGFWGVRLTEERPAVGDLVCWSREPGVDYDHQFDGVYKGHCDLIVDKNATTVSVIGGNVGNSVTRRPLPLNDAGFLTANEGAEQRFALMKCRIV
jgi:Uncharacterized protein conserved in bacteria (DUF2272)